MLIRSRQSRDAHLVRRTLLGQRDAYAELVHGYIAAATGFALSRVRSRADAEDIAQESFIRAFERLDTLRDPAKFGPWLFGIVRNCAGRVHERRRSEVTLDPAHADAWPAVSPDFARDEIFAELRRMVDVLPDTQREIVLLHYFSKQKTRVIATMLDMSPAAVRKQLERARKQLGRKILEQASEGFELDRDLVKKTLAVVAATQAAWVVAPASVASAAAITALPGVSWGKITAAAVLVTAGVGLFAVVSNRPPTNEVETEFAVEEPAIETAPIRIVVQTPSAPAVAAVVTPTPDADPPSPAVVEVPPPIPQPAEAIAQAPVQVAGQTPIAHEAISAGTPVLDPTEDESALSVPGILIDRDGKPIANTPVSIQLMAGNWGMGSRKELMPVTAIAKTVSGPDGRFLFNRLETDGHTNFIGELVAEGPGLSGFSRAILSAIGYRTPRIDIEMRTTEPLSGRVVDAAKNPLRGAVIQPTAYEARGPETLNVIMPDVPAFETDASGRFSVTRLYAGRWKFLVSAPGFASRVTEFVETGQSDVNIILDPGVHVSGRLNLPDSVQRRVRLAMMHQEQYFEFHLVELDPAAGTFETTSLRPGNHLAWLDDPELILTGTMELKIPEGRPALTQDLTVIVGGVITGRLVDAATGEGIAGVNVLARLAKGQPYMHPYMTQREATSDSEGRFAVRGLVSGLYQLYCAPHPEIPAPLSFAGWPAQPLPVQTGMAIGAPDWPIDRRYRLTGTVLMPDGRPATHVTVEVRPRGEGEAQAAILNHHSEIPVDAQGGFVVYVDEPTSNVYVRALGKDLVSHEAGPLSIGANNTPVTLQLEPAGSISGQLLGKTGAPLNRPFTATGAVTGSQLMLTTNVDTRKLYLSPKLNAKSNGQFYLAPLPADTYTIVSGGLPVTVDLAPGEHRTNEDVSVFPPAAGKFLEGRVLLHGKPVANCTVRIHRDEARTDDRGMFKISEYPEENFHVDLYMVENGITVQRELTIPAGAPVLNRTPLEIAFATGPASVEGRLFRNGRPWRGSFGVNTQLADGAKEYVYVATNDQGAYAIDGLPAGNNEITFHGGDSTVKQKSIELNLAPGLTKSQDIYIDASLIEIDVHGMATGEKGVIRVVAGSDVITELTVATIVRIESEMVFERTMMQDGMQYMEVLEPGPYVVYVAAYSAAADSAEELLPTIRYQAVPIEVVGYHSTVFSVDIERGPSVVELVPFPTEK
jgi:RNA polymerase sigma factor (sigma-70 family)